MQQVRRIKPHERPGYVFAGHTNLAVESLLTQKSDWYVTELVDLPKGLNSGSQVLNELAVLYFEISPPRSANVNPFGDIMSSLFGGSPGSGPSPTAGQPRTITPGGGRAQLTLD